MNEILFINNNSAAKEILNKEEDECLKKLRDLIKGDKYLKHLQAENDYLQRFLVSTDYNVNTAFKRVKDHYDLMLEYPEWFPIKSPIEKRNIIEKNLRIVPGTCDKEGRIVYIIKVGNMDLSIMDLYEDLIPIDDIFAENYQMGNNTILRSKGVAAILDIANISLKLLRMVTPHNIRMVLRRVQAMPIKEYSFHVVNDSFLVNAAIKIIWPFLPQSIKNVVHFHFSDWESLHKFIAKEALPTEYGGVKDDPYSEYHKQLYENSEEIANNFKIRRQFYLESIKNIK